MKSKNYYRKFIILFRKKIKESFRSCPLIKETRFGQVFGARFMQSRESAHPNPAAQKIQTAFSKEQNNGLKMQMLL